MDIIKVNSDTGNLPPTVATIGFFDGVHRGHQYLIRNVVEEARRSHMTSTVITFDRDPRQVLQSDYRPNHARWQAAATLQDRLRPGGRAVVLSRDGRSLGP